MNNYIDGCPREEDAIAGGAKPRLLLHVCCAPCLCGVIDRLYSAFDLTVYFYNPNIQPNGEFMRRLDAVKALIERYPDVRLIVPTQSEEEFLKIAEGMENAPEGGARCERCIALRMENTALYMSSHEGYDFFATTLTVSPHKNALSINRAGAALSDKYGVRYMQSDFKKKDGFALSVRLSKQLGLYRQNYCGCRLQPADDTVRE